MLILRMLIIPFPLDCFSKADDAASFLHVQEEELE